MNPASHSLSSPEEVELQSPTHISTLGASSQPNLINLGHGRFISDSFIPPHSVAICEPSLNFTKDKHALGGKRRVRGRCKICGKAANAKCSICNNWHCNPRTITDRFCFEEHKAAQIMKERLTQYAVENP